jgi:hypothetical protein
MTTGNRGRPHTLIAKPVGEDGARVFGHGQVRDFGPFPEKALEAARQENDEALGEDLTATHIQQTRVERMHDMKYNA